MAKQKKIYPFDVDSVPNGRASVIRSNYIVKFQFHFRLFVGRLYIYENLKEKGKETAKNIAASISPSCGGENASPKTKGVLGQHEVKRKKNKGKNI